MLLITLHLKPMTTKCPKCNSEDLQSIAFLCADEDHIPKYKEVKCESCLKKFFVSLETGEIVDRISIREFLE